MVFTYGLAIVSWVIGVGMFQDGFPFKFESGGFFGNTNYMYVFLDSVFWAAIFLILIKLMLHRTIIKSKTRK